MKYMILTYASQQDYDGMAGQAGDLPATDLNVDRAARGDLFYPVPFERDARGEQRRGPYEGKEGRSQRPAKKRHKRGAGRRDSGYDSNDSGHRSATHDEGLGCFFHVVRQGNEEIDHES